jgi:endonuclease/exonuclease/phosphatase family metal-dependent hydrolase
MKKTHRVRVVTYNIHKCRGLDRHVRPDRIVKVLSEIDADVVALQEVLSIEGRAPENDQARFIAHGLGLDYRMGENRRLMGGAYGNLVLSRLPMLAAINYDLSQRGHEERGCLRVDVGLGSYQVLHIYNVHLGTAWRERPHQARRLLDEEILSSAHIPGPRILLGDFNEWMRGVASRLLAEHFQSADIRLHLGHRRTYPGVFPFLHLDHIYYDKALKLERVALHRSRTALVASDHLPLVADFTLIPEPR